MLERRGSKKEERQSHVCARGKGEKGEKKNEKEEKKREEKKKGRKREEKVGGDADSGRIQVAHEWLRRSRPVELRWEE